MRFSKALKRTYSKMTKIKNTESLIKLFGMSNQMAELDLKRIEEKFNIDLGRDNKTLKKDNVYYPQFDLEVRNEAKEMAKYYEIFYSLEKSIRGLIHEEMVGAEGDTWWEKIPQVVKDEVKKRINNEKDAGVTIRSSEPIDYTTFGELGEIIKSNWSVFGDIFNSRKAVVRVMNNLNTIRGPIAHCSMLAEDEVVRLQITVRDWFRLME